MKREEENQEGPSRYSANSVGAKLAPLLSLSELRTTIKR